ncbi:MAG: magnesium/cobalt transporter CorA [Aquificae bacterium]|nr:magnesium/cobalt transporter CorA [Aquificota bacterium]
MLKIYVNTLKGFEEVTPERVKEYAGKYVVWFDLIDPDDEELELVSRLTGFRKPPKLEELELSSKYVEERDALEITLSFVIAKKEEILIEHVVFYIKEKFFVTFRYGDVPAISLFKLKVNEEKKFYQFPESLFAEILAIEVDRIGRKLEDLGRRIKNARKEMVEGRLEELVHELAFYDELTLTLRESVNEKLRIIAKCLKSPLVNAHTKKELKVTYEDLTTLLDYTAFYLEKIDSIQSSLLGLITIKQNEAVKVFTVLAAVFLPATLIASIFGMNFKHMPELSWKFGYPYSLFLMVSTTAVLLFWVRRKGWL